MNGVLILDKPAGMTSFDVIRRLRKATGEKKIGHGGTLDPEVTGVLPVFFGNATKAADLLPESGKEYEAEMILGLTTDTEDLTGTVLSESPVNVTEEEVREAVLSFTGPYLQIPPMVSAKKVGGKKLVDLQRKGVTVERKAEERSVERIEIRAIALPVIRFKASVSKGTYIRTLAADIGKKLGTGGTLKSLRRTRHGRFTEFDAIPLSEAETLAAEGVLSERLLPVEDLFPDFPKLSVKPEADRFLKNGNRLIPGNFASYTDLSGSIPQDTFRIAFSTGEFCGLYRFDKESGEFVPVKMFLPEKG